MNSTLEDAAHTVSSKIISARISAHFDAFGSAHLDRVHEMIQTNEDRLELFFKGESWGFLRKPNELVFSLGVCHGFSVASLARIVREFDVDPLEFIGVIVTNGRPHLRFPPRWIDFRGFHSKMIEACTHLNPEAAKDLFIANMDHSDISLAYITSGDCEGVVDDLLDVEYEDAKQGLFLHERPLQGCLAELSTRPRASGHLPNTSPVDFIHKLGGLNPHMVRKTLNQNNCWENLFSHLGNEGSASDFTCNTMLPAIFSDKHAALNDDKLRMLLSNLTMESSEHDFTLDVVTEATLAFIQNTSFGDYLDKLTFGLSFARTHLIQFYEYEPVSLDFSFGANNLGPLCQAMQQRFIDAGDRFLQTIMEETLALPVEHLGYHHLSLPYVLKFLALPKQHISKGVAETYLTRMAQVIAEFTLADTPLGSKRVMDDHIHQGMSHILHLIQKNPTLNLSLIDLEDTGLVDQLVRWGLDVSLIPHPSDKNLSFSLERDLGL
jgi:hypothetical protein